MERGDKENNVYGKQGHGSPAPIVEVMVRTGHLRQLAAECIQVNTTGQKEGRKKRGSSDKKRNAIFGKRSSLARTPRIEGLARKKDKGCSCNSDTEVFEMLVARFVKTIPERK